MKLSRGLSEIRIGRDVVAIEDATRFVSTDRDICGETRLIDRHQPLIIESRPDRLELDLYISELPIPP